MSTRLPAVAGQFYPSNPSELRRTIEECFTHQVGPGRMPPSDPPPSPILGLICPHAGYMYSGPVAAHSYYYCSGGTRPELVVIFGPNHYMVGSGVAAPRAETWRTPLGDVTVDVEGARRLANSSKMVDLDDTTHQYEHSIEVQIPFLQYLFGAEFKILPISMSMQDYETAVEVGRSVLPLVRERPSLVIASSDLTHYEAHETASRKDAGLIELIVRLEIAEYYTILERQRISACGYGPIAAVMALSKSMNAKEARLLKYATSGDTTGDRRAVVGYPSLVFH